MILTPTCIVCDETNHLRPCGLYGGATISTAYICATHDDPPRTICTGCDDAFREPAEPLTHWVGRFVYPWAQAEPIDGHYCAYCIEEIEHDAHYRGAAQ